MQACNGCDTVDYVDTLNDSGVCRRVHVGDDLMWIYETIADELNDELGSRNQGPKRDALDRKFAEAFAEYVIEIASDAKNAATQMRFIREAIERVEGSVARVADPESY